MDTIEAIKLLKGMRVFVTSRERIKQPEGHDLFDKAIETLEAAESVAQGGEVPEHLEDVLYRLDEWCRAYPESVFPEPTDEDVAAVNSVYPNAVTRISASMGRHMVKHMRSMADAVRKIAARPGGDDPIGWVFQHDETGRTTFCPNDGVNNPDSFAANNPRFVLSGPAYAHPAPAGGDAGEA